MIQIDDSFTKGSEEEAGRLSILLELENYIDDLSQSLYRFLSSNFAPQ